MIKRVDSPVVSPDGKWVVVSVAAPAYDEKKEVSDLWIVPPDGSAPTRRLTSGKGSETGADCSPDSQRYPGGEGSTEDLATAWAPEGSSIVLWPRPTATRPPSRP